MGGTKHRRGAKEDGRGEQESVSHILCVLTLYESEGETQQDSARERTLHGQTRTSYIQFSAKPPRC